MMTIRNAVGHFVVVMGCVVALGAQAVEKTYTWSLPSDFAAEVSCADGFAIVQADGAMRGVGEVGAPDLPVYNFMVTIPKGGSLKDVSFTAEWDEVKVEGQGQQWILPSPVAQPVTAGEKVVYPEPGPQYDGVYPAEAAYAGEGMLSGNKTLQPIRITPFRWDGATKTLYAATKLEVKVVVVEKPTLKLTTSSADTSEGEVLILAPHDFVPLWQGYAAFRKSTDAGKNFTFIVKDTSEIYADTTKYMTRDGDYALALHHYIESDFYDSSKCDKQYIILGASPAKTGTFNPNTMIPTRYFFGDSGTSPHDYNQAGDVYYGCMERLKAGKTDASVEVWDVGNDGVYWAAQNTSPYNFDANNSVDWTMEIAVTRVPLLERSVEKLNDNTVEVTASDMMNSFTNRIAWAESAAFETEDRGKTYVGGNEAEGDQKGGKDERYTGERYFFDGIKNMFDPSRSGACISSEWGPRDRTYNIMGKVQPQREGVIISGPINTTDLNGAYSRSGDLATFYSHGDWREYGNLSASRAYQGGGFYSVYATSFSCMSGKYDTNGDGAGITNALCFGEAPIVAPNCQRGALVTLTSARDGWSGGFGTLSMALDAYFLNALYGLADGTPMNAAQAGKYAHNTYAATARGTQSAHGSVLGHAILCGDPLIKVFMMPNRTELTGYSQKLSVSTASTKTFDISTDVAASQAAFSDAGNGTLTLSGDGKFRTTSSLTVTNVGELVWNVAGGAGRNGIVFSGTRGNLTCEGTKERYFGPKLTNVGTISVPGGNVTLDFDTTACGFNKLEFVNDGGQGTDRPTNMLRTRKEGFIPSTQTIPVVNSALRLQTINIGGGNATLKDAPLFYVTNGVLKVENNPYWGTEYFVRPTYLSDASILGEYASFGLGRPDSDGYDLYVDGTSSLGGDTPIKVTGELRIHLEDADTTLTITNALANGHGGAAGSLALSGTGTVRIATPQTFTGGITVGSGVKLVLAIANAVMGDITVQDGGQLEFETTITSGGTITLNSGSGLILPTSSTGHYHMIDARYVTLVMNDGVSVYDAADTTTPLTGKRSGEHYINTSAALYWNTSGATWTTGSSQGNAWRDQSGNAASYSDGKTVIFGALSSGNPVAVTVGIDVAPGFVDFANADCAYVFSASGSPLVTLPADTYIAEAVNFMGSIRLRMQGGNVIAPDGALQFAGQVLCAYGDGTTMTVREGGKLYLNGSFGPALALEDGAVLAVTNSSALTKYSYSTLTLPTTGRVIVDASEATKTATPFVILSGYNLTAADLAKFEAASEDMALSLNNGDLYVVTQGVKVGPYAASINTSETTLDWSDLSWTDRDGDEFAWTTGINVQSSATATVEVVSLSTNGLTLGVNQACGIGMLILTGGSTATLTLNWTAEFLPLTIDCSAYAGKVIINSGSYTLASTEIIAGSDTWVTSSSCTAKLTVASGMRAIVNYPWNGTKTIAAGGTFGYGNDTSSSVLAMGNLKIDGRYLELAGTHVIDGTFESSTAGTKIIVTGTVSTENGDNEVCLAGNAKSVFEVAGGTFTLGGRAFTVRNGTSAINITGGTVVSASNKGFLYNGGGFSGGVLDLNISGGSFAAMYGPYHPSSGSSGIKNNTLRVNVSGEGVFAPLGIRYSTDGNYPSTDNSSTDISDSKHAVNMTGGTFSAPATVPNWLPVNVTSGTANLGAQSAGTATVRSTVSVSSGATLCISSGTVAFGGSGKLTGAGNLIVRSGTTFTVPYANLANNITVEPGATLNLTGDALTSSGITITTGTFLREPNGIVQVNGTTLSSDYAIDGNRIISSSSVQYGPLLQESWQQHEPYNYFAAMVDGERTPCGCVATGVSLAFHHYAWPYRTGCVTEGAATTSGLSGVGAFNLAIDGHNPFLWSEMLDANTQTTTLGEFQVARLHIWSDAMAKMCFQTGGSNTALYNVPEAAARWYEKGEELKPSTGDYRERVKQEVAAGYPVQVTITDSGTGTGHQVVIDGWRGSDGLYHVNYGQNSAATTWYAMTASTLGAWTVESFWVGMVPRKLVQLEPISTVGTGSVTLNWHVPAIHTNAVTGFMIKDWTYSGTAGKTTIEDAITIHPVNADYYRIGTVYGLTDSSSLTYTLSSYHTCDLSVKLEARYDGGEWFTLDTPEVSTTEDEGGEGGKPLVPGRKDYTTTINFTDKAGKALELRFATLHTSNASAANTWINANTISLANVVAGGEPTTVSVGKAVRSYTVNNLAEGTYHSFTVTPVMDGAIESESVGRRVVAAASVPEMPAIESIDTMGSAITEGFCRTCKNGQNVFFVRCNETVTSCTASSSHRSLMGTDDVTVRDLGSQTYAVVIDGSDVPNMGNLILTIAVKDERGNSEVKDLWLAFTTEGSSEDTLADAIKQNNCLFIASNATVDVALDNTKKIIGWGRAVFTGGTPTGADIGLNDQDVWRGTVELKNYSGDIDLYQLSSLLKNAQSELCLNGATGAVTCNGSVSVEIGAGGLSMSSWTAYNSAELVVSVSEAALVNGKVLISGAGAASANITLAPALVSAGWSLAKNGSGNWVLSGGPIEPDPNQMYYNKLSAGNEDVKVARGTYGDIEVPSVGYYATTNTALTTLGASGTGIGGSYAGIIKTGTYLDTHTVVGWFKIDALPTGSNLTTIYLAKSCDNSDNGYKVAVDASGEILVGKINYASGAYSWNGSNYKTTDNAVVTAGKWFHLAVAITKTANAKTVTPAVFVNGASVAIASGTFAGNLNGNSCSALMIGAGVTAAGIYVDTTALSDADKVASFATNEYYLTKGEEEMPEPEPESPVLVWEGNSATESRTMSLAVEKGKAFTLIVRMTNTTQNVGQYIMGFTSNADDVMTPFCVAAGGSNFSGLGEKISANGFAYKQFRSGGFNVGIGTQGSSGSASWKTNKYAENVPLYVCIYSAISGTVDADGVVSGLTRLHYARKSTGGYDELSDAGVALTISAALDTMNLNTSAANVEYKVYLDHNQRDVSGIKQIIGGIDPSDPEPTGTPRFAINFNVSQGSGGGAYSTAGQGLIAGAVQTVAGEIPLTAWTQQTTYASPTTTPKFSNVTAYDLVGKTNAATTVAITEYMKNTTNISANDSRSSDYAFFNGNLSQKAGTDENDGVVTFTNIPYDKYDVYVYFSCVAASDVTPSEPWTTYTTYNPLTVKVNDGTAAYYPSNAAWGNTTNVNELVENENYLCITNLTGAKLELTTKGKFRGIAAVQIVGTYNDEPEPEQPETVTLAHQFDFNSRMTSQVGGATPHSTSASYVDGICDKAMTYVGNSGSWYGDSGINGGDGNWSVVLVAKAPATAGHMLFSMGAKSDSNGFGVASAGTGGLKAVTWSSGASAADVVTATASEATSTYHFYVFAYDATSHKLKCSVDGADYTEGVAYTYTKNSKWQIGGIHGGSVGSYVNATSGSLDELRVYTGQLTTDDIAAIMAEFQWPYEATISGDTAFDAITGWTTNGVAATLPDDLTAIKISLKGNGLVTGLDQAPISLALDEGVACDVTDCTDTSFSGYGQFLVRAESITEARTFDAGLAWGVIGGATAAAQATVSAALTVNCSPFYSYGYVKLSNATFASSGISGLYSYDVRVVSGNLTLGKSMLSPRSYDVAKDATITLDSEVELAVVSTNMLQGSGRGGGFYGQGTFVVAAGRTVNGGYLGIATKFAYTGDSVFRCQYIWADHGHVGANATLKFTVMDTTLNTYLIDMLTRFTVDNGGKIVLYKHGESTAFATFTSPANGTRFTTDQLFGTAATTRDFETEGSQTMGYQGLYTNAVRVANFGYDTGFISALVDEAHSEVTNAVPSEPYSVSLYADLGAFTATNIMTIGDAATKAIRLRVGEGLLQIVEVTGETIRETGIVAARGIGFHLFTITKTDKGVALYVDGQLVGTDFAFTSTVSGPVTIGTGVSVRMFRIDEVLLSEALVANLAAMWPVNETTTPEVQSTTNILSQIRMNSEWAAQHLPESVVTNLYNHEAIKPDDEITGKTEEREQRLEEYQSELEKLGKNGLPLWQSYLQGLDPDDTDKTHARPYVNEVRFEEDAVNYQATNTVVELSYANPARNSGINVTYHLAAKDAVGNVTRNVPAIGSKAMIVDDSQPMNFTPKCEIQPKKPNIIFVLADDLGYGDVGWTVQNARQAAGNQRYISTPHMDQMVAEGCELTAHYAAAPVCAPSRASILTGKHQGTCSLRDNSFDCPILEERTIGTVMREQGYVTHAIGKWGVGGGGESGLPMIAHPLDRGFDHFYGFLDHGAGHTYYHYDGLLNGAYMGIMEDRERKTETAVGLYSTDLLMARAKKVLIDQVNANKASGTEKPVFMYLAINAMHGSGADKLDASVPNKVNLHVPGRAFPDCTPGTAATYGLNNGLDWDWLQANREPINDRNTFIYDYAKDSKYNTTQARYATTITRLDEAMQDLKQTIIDLGIADNTIIVFTSDNGPTNEYGTNKDDFDSNGEFREGKRSCYEGGLREPTFIWAPGYIKAGSVDNRPSMNHSWMQFFEEVAKSNTAPQMNNEVYSEYKYGGSQIMVRIDDYVGVNTDVGSCTLDDIELAIYNVVTDPGQNTNIASTAKGQELLPRMQALMKSYHTLWQRPGGFGNGDGAKESSGRPYDNK